MQFPKVQISKQWDPFKTRIMVEKPIGPWPKPPEGTCPPGQFDPGSGECIACPPDFVYDPVKDVCIHKDMCPDDFHWVGTHYQVDLDTTVGGGCILNNSECEKAFICPKCPSGTTSAATGSFLGTALALLIIPAILGGSYYIYKRKQKGLK